MSAQLAERSERKLLRELTPAFCFAEIAERFSAVKAAGAHEPYDSDRP